MYNLFCTSLVSLLMMSCSLDHKSVYHKDETQSMQIETNLKEFLAMYNAFAGEEDADFNKSLEDLKKIPNEWTTVYKAGSEIFDDAETPKKETDTVRMMKKVYIKSDYDGDEYKGLSVKYDRMEAKYVNIWNAFLMNEENSFKLPTSAFSEMKNKKMVINTADFVSPEIKRMLVQSVSENEEQSQEQLKYILKIFDVSINNELYFENKIKSVQGKHDWVTQKDDHTLIVNYKLSHLFDPEKTPKQTDQKIIVTTE